MSLSRNEIEKALKQKNQNHYPKIIYTLKIRTDRMEDADGIDNRQ